MSFWYFDVARRVLCRNPLRKIIEVKKGKELIKHAECSDVLIECKLLAAMSGKVNSIQKFPGQGSLES